MWEMRAIDLLNFNQNFIRNNFRAIYRIACITLLLGSGLYAQPDTLSTLSPGITEAIPDTSITPPLQSEIIPYKSGIRPWRLTGIITGVSGTTAGIFLYFQNVWWADQSAKFHFDTGSDMVYALGMDKCGHFWSSKLTSDLFYDMLSWSGVPRKSALWYGAGYGILTTALVEIKDGLAPYWGFSLGDMTANTAGALFPVAQEYIPVLRNFQVKWSYDFLNPSYYKTLENNGDKPFMDDYERHNYWLSANVHGLLPKPLKPYWPEFLNIAAGLSAERLNGKGSGNHEIFLALDYDLTKIPVKSKTLRRAFHYLNHLHFPAPTIRITPRVRLYGVNF